MALVALTLSLIGLLIVHCEAFLPTAPPTQPVKPETILAAEVSQNEAMNSRREILGSVMIGAVALSPFAANALDMDAFANSQVSL